MNRPIIIVRRPARIEAERSAQTVQSLPAARYVLVALLMLATYISLEAPSGWRTPPQGFLAILTTTPRFRLGDVLINVVGYVPMGFFGVLAFARSRRPIWVALILSVTLCTALSALTEILQSMTPSVSSNPADVFSNAVGALAGALAASIVMSWVSFKWLGGLRDRHIAPGWLGDIGLALLALWALSMLAPRTLLFGVGDARFYLEVPAREGLQPALFHGVEAVVCALALLGFALLLRLTFTFAAFKLRAVLLLAIIASLVIRTSGFGMFWGPSNAFIWLSPGAVLGMAIGTLLAFALIELPQRAAGIVATIVLSISVLIVNVSPPNPALWHKKHLRWQGISKLAVASRMTAMMWPAAAIGLALVVAVQGRGNNTNRRPML